VRSRVLVTDVEERSSLAACRGLAAAGYRVTGVAAGSPAPAHWSRSCHWRAVLPDPRDDPDAFLGGLENILREESHAILLPSTDVSMWLVSEQRERFAGLVHLALPDHDAVAAVLDKTRLIEEAPAVGLAAPASVVCSGFDEGISAAERLGLPVVVKPARSFVPDGGRFRQRPVTIVNDEPALGAALSDIGSPFLVQRYEEHGRVVSLAGVMTTERLLASVAVRWQRRWPPISGAASFCETIAPPDGLTGRVERLLLTLRFSGIFELELLELGGSRFAAIDLNPRPFGWMSLAVRAGANLPALLCDWLRGADPTTVRGAPGLRYRWEDGDLRHLLWQLRRADAAAAAAVLRPRRRVVHPHFQLADPAPLAARAAFLVSTWRRRRRRATPGSPREAEQKRRLPVDLSFERRRGVPAPGHEAHDRPEARRSWSAEEMQAGDRRLEPGRENRVAVGQAQRAQELRPEEPVLRHVDPVARGDDHVVDLSPAPIVER
jgi:predicted ATP-grasp superfamily ATP-dependent carboligase